MPARMSFWSLNEFCADLIAASPYQADPMALGALGKAKGECLGNVARERNANAYARCGDINNLAFYPVIFTFRRNARRWS